MIRRARALTSEDLDELLEPAVDLGRLSEAEADKADRPSRRSGRPTDANGVPITDPASFAGLYTYPLSCDDLQGNILDSVEE